VDWIVAFAGQRRGTVKEGVGPRLSTPADVVAKKRAWGRLSLSAERSTFFVGRMIDFRCRPNDSAAIANAALLRLDHAEGLYRLL
jgi:hypothetical protein